MVLSSDEEAATVSAVVVGQATGAVPPRVLPAAFVRHKQPSSGGQGAVVRAQSTQRKTSAAVVILDDSDDGAAALTKAAGRAQQPSTKRTKRRKRKKPLLTEANTFLNDSANVADDQGLVLVNVGRSKSESPAYLAKELADVVKPHQIGGIRFLYDTLIESDQEFRNEEGLGCILAHSMGLGKTIQIVAFVHTTIKRFEKMGDRPRVLIIVPVNTVTNWRIEFDKWLQPKSRIPVAVLSDNVASFRDRSALIRRWYEHDRGVLLIGYEMFRILTCPADAKAVRKGTQKSRPKSSATRTDGQEGYTEANFAADVERNFDALCSKGPDVVICDEGHRIKNADSSISKHLKRIRTKRRVVLTGYPLQNNLEEYWCMVDFVRPNYLGDIGEFRNRFVNPILNGQCVDSKPSDAALMRERAFVLHRILHRFVQRRDESTLVKSLPAKKEYIIPIRLTPLQERLYLKFLRHRITDASAGSLFKAYASLAKIWNHPDLLHSEMCPGSNDRNRKHSWAEDELKGYIAGIFAHSNKFVALMTILKVCIEKEQKLLVFSQSLGTLDCIEQVQHQALISMLQQYQISVFRSRQPSVFNAFMTPVSS